jgi:hypothetical protein
MKNRILLQENENVAQSVIDLEQNHATNWKKVGNLLNECGLNVQDIDNWTEIEALLSKDFQFPKATIEFNLDALGIRTQYEQAKELYEKKLKGIRYNIEVTPERIEEIKEEYRVYATTQNQIDAINTARSIVESVNKLNELGIRVTIESILQSCYIFSSEGRSKLTINERNLFADVIGIK